MIKTEDYSVKVYNINPIESISALIDALVNLEFEVYSLSSSDKEKLLNIIPLENCRVIIFFSIISKKDLEEWLKYTAAAKAINHPNLQLGVFCYNTISEEDKNKFLSQSVPVILFSSVEKNTLEILQNLLTVFEAKGKRAYVRIKSYGSAEVYFYFKIRQDPLLAKATDISASAFSVEIDSTNKNYFTVGGYIDDVLLVLLGVRLRVAVKVLGFSNENPNIYIFKYCSSKIQNDKVVYTDNVPNDVSLKVHNYIRKCLKRDITKLLSEAE